MEIVNNTLYISYRELVRSEDNPAGVMPEGTYKKLMFVTKVLKRLSRGCYSQEVLIEFNSVPIKYRSQWIELHGDPMATQKSRSFIARIKPDTKACEIFTTYRYDGNKALSEETVRRYSNDAAILNAIRGEIDDMKQARARHSSRPTGYWDAALERVNSIREFYLNTLPKRPVSLRRKYERYIEEGYYSLIHAGYGNQNSSSFTNPTANALMLELCGYGSQLTAPKIAQTYNIWAKANGEPMVSERAVIAFMHRHEVDITYHREGKAVWRDKYDKVIGRDRPSTPLLLINVDDNDLDLLYISKRYVTKRDKRTGEITTHEVKDEFYRPKLYIVLDVHCNYVLGYAVGDSVTVDLVHRALRNAAQHVKELTGSYYLWHQIVADNWSHKNLKPYFEAQATTTFTVVGNARSKPIESFFGTVWHDSLKHELNYCGTGIKSMKHLDPEWVKKNVKHRPPREECHIQIAKHIERLRSREWNRSGRSCREVWLENFKKSEASHERAIDTETYLMLFGERNTNLNTVTNKGITMTIGGEKLHYDIPHNIYRDVIGRKMQVIYDPNNLNEVLVQDENHRFIATPYINQPMAIADMKQGDGVRLKQRLDEKKALQQQMVADAVYRQELLDTNGIDVEALLQAGVLIKETSIDANAAYNRHQWGGKVVDNDDDDDNFLSTFYSPKTNKKQIAQ